MLRFGRLAVVAAGLCFSALAFAQGGATGAITGTVQDATGAVILGAKVNVINEATGQVLRQSSTDSSGTFTATLLPVGNYSLEVSAPDAPVVVLDWGLHLPLVGLSSRAP